MENKDVRTISALSAEMDPIPTNGEENFPIDKTKHTRCEYEGASFTIKKRRPRPRTLEYIFEADNNAGRVECTVGEISWVFVNEIARRCGLGTILVTLCLVDTDMNGNGNVHPPLDMSNWALEILEDNQRSLDWVEANCKSFWNLYFNPYDNGAGVAYFNAALDAGFTQMLIKDVANVVHGPTSTRTWRESYNSDSGMIGPDINVENSFWFFCEPDHAQ